MGRLLRIPFLVDLIRTGDPAEICLFAKDPRLDRNFTACGPLLNRLLTHKIRSTLALDGVPLPAVASRANMERARTQVELRAQLDAAAAGAFDEDSIIGLAKAVRGLQDAPILELAVQQVVGRLFAGDYRATEESWAAALLLDKAAHSMNPLAAILWTITGQIAQAQHGLAEKVHNDHAGVHATGIAIHNLVRGFAQMRKMLASADRPTSDRIVALCLRAPESVLRQAVPETPTQANGIRPGTLVVLDLGSAQQSDSGPEIVFMAGSWSQCPAAAWVPALLRAVWERALELQPPQPCAASGPFRLEFARTEAGHRRVLYRNLLGCNLVLQFALGVTMLAAPLWVSQLVAGSPAAAGFVRIWGLMLLLVTALYAAGWFDPIFTRWPNVVGIVGRCASALLYICLGGGFLWFALFDAAFAAALMWAYQRALQAELMTRP